MDNSRSLKVTKLKSRDNLNLLCQSFHEGIYSFTKDVSSNLNNYPENSISGFLFINTDFDDKYCVQKITTMDNKFFYRTGEFSNGLFVWSSWDSYISLEDIPESEFAKNEKNYIKKEDFLPKISKSSNINPEEELSSIMDEYYKYYGEYKGENLFELPSLINRLEGPYKEKNKKFIFGFFIKDDEDNYNERDLNRVPTGKAGLLQVLSSLFKSGNKVNKEYPVIDTVFNENDQVDLFTTIIFTEFDTGDVYVTRIFNFSDRCVVNDRFANIDPDTSNSSTLSWSKYSYSKVRSYNLNAKALEFLRLRNRQFQGSRFTDINSIIGDYDNTRNEEYLKNRRYDLSTLINDTTSWNNDSNIAINNNDRGIPYFNHNIEDKDFSIITSLFPTGTAFKYPMLKGDFINTAPYNRIGYDGNNYAGRFIMPVWNTFNLTYSTLKLTKDRFISEEITKED